LPSPALPATNAGVGSRTAAAEALAGFDFEGWSAVDVTP